MTVAVIFCRISAIIMLAPALGEILVLRKIKLTLALLVTLLLFISLGDYVSSCTKNTNDYLSFLILVIQETIIGLSIGFILRLGFWSLHTAGMIIASQLGLSAATLFDPAQRTQGTVISTFLSMLGVIIIFSSNMHLVIIQSLASTYEIVPVGSLNKNYSEISELLVLILRKSWVAGMQISAPFIVSSIALMIGAGVLSRLMPQLQVFFVVIPAQIVIGIITAMLVFGGMCFWFVNYYADVITQTLPV